MDCGDHKAELVSTSVDDSGPQGVLIKIIGICYVWLKRSHESIRTKRISEHTDKTQNNKGCNDVTSLCYHTYVDIKKRQTAFIKQTLDKKIEYVQQRCRRCVLVIVPSCHLLSVSMIKRFCVYYLHI